MLEQSSHHLERKEKKQSERIDLLVLWGIIVGRADDLADELAQLVGLERGVPVIAIHGTGEAESSCTSKSKQKN